MATGRRYRGGLVDLGAGLISREIFVNEEIYAEELERVFTRAWLQRRDRGAPCDPVVKSCGRPFKPAFRRPSNPSPRRRGFLGPGVPGVPLGRLPSPTDYAKAAVFLASDDAAMITGADR
jgi:hypothetical protein